jgi:acyl-coenzyme A thioesterase PaaI-like protein
MRLSENTLKWVMRLYPPLLFQRIWVKKIYKGFCGADIKINRSLVTINLGNAIFGGTIFSATDPFYAMLFGQQMLRQGFKTTIWLKSAEIKYIKPARTNLFYTIRISPEMTAEAVATLKTQGKFVKAYPIEIFNKHGELCATAMNEVYIRDLNFVKPNVDASPSVGF